MPVAPDPNPAPAPFGVARVGGPIPPMDHGAGDKPSAFTWAMGEYILARMATGETMASITADARMPAYCTVFHWARTIPEFGARYRGMRAALAQARLAARDARRALTPKRRSGQRSTYTQARGEAVCAAVRGGRSLSAVVAMPGMPSFKAIYRWLADVPAFRADYVEACDWRAGWLEFQIEAAVEASTPFTLDAAKREVAALRGRIGRLTPKTYRWIPPPR